MERRVSDTDLDTMALAIAEFARSNNAWSDDIHTIADAYDLLVGAAEMAAGSEHTHDSQYGTRPWPPQPDDLPNRVRRFAATEPRVWRAGDPEPDDVRAVLDRDGNVWQRSAYLDGTGWWMFDVDYAFSWSGALKHGPLVEVVLPAPVAQ